MLVKIDKKGRVTLPKMLRNQARFKLNSRMRAEVRERSIVLKPLPDKSDFCTSGDSLLWLLRHPAHVDARKLKKIDLDKIEREMWYP